MTFNSDDIISLVECYVYDPPKGYDKKIHDDVQYLYEWCIEGISDDEFLVKIPAILDCFKLGHDDDERRDYLKAVKNYPKDELSFIASHFCFMYGLVYAENCDLVLNIERPTIKSQVVN